ncbi:MAG TPA: helix-turn-helix domain-containing protein [Chitinophagales bacterium]|nr:helix-turn-helix domain-containing protein [Chitinophagales bacterium]MCB9075198.1 helix-turn-helix domain-containing protein [Chitinophagales bacterium]HMU97986.1 helix-turn-helix domain-containing protein [Chitinophagales bacterium]HMV02266.1 helix-turn-helix domain-containing protein [Chitinophagales bacterium]HMW94088.1 helix-turn-helix domain-containing protein [Chitinophagales bacterium]
MQHNKFLSEQELAKDFVQNTFVNVFVTGKAGTGKTTFLKSIQETTQKKMAVAAPTGVAAINAGGVTLHSLFQLPIGAFLPTKKHFSEIATNINSLFSNLKMGKAKLDLINELELLVIDEVSMLRCDTLDCIDIILKTIRKNQQEAFGGVQVLFIGDMFQLPPVIKDEEWNLLSQFYNTPFFFSAQVMQECHYVHIEFTEIFRQTDNHFIRLLNNVRNNEMEEEDFIKLNERFQPDVIEELDNFITLTTHNWKADKINQNQLAKLDGDIFTFNGSLEGDFNDKALPTEMELNLKVGAQVMFVKNDIKPEKKYYNGKLAQIIKISKEDIVVSFFDDKEEYTLEKAKWDNVRYEYNAEDDKINEKIIGSFSQFPIRLAWAVTIHKSQGLTFDRAVIDAGQSFAAGQVYVALSRCRSLEGVFLLTKIAPNAIKSDERIVVFTQDSVSKISKLVDELDFHKFEFAKAEIYKCFSWDKYLEIIEDYRLFAIEKKLPEKEVILEKIAAVKVTVSEINTISVKFNKWLEQNFALDTQATLNAVIKEKLEKSIVYFGQIIAQNILSVLDTIIDELKVKKNVKGFVKATESVHKTFLTKLHEIEGFRFLDERLYQEESHYTRQYNESSSNKLDTKEVSLMMYKSDKTIDEIAKLRDLTTTTIEGHLAHFIQLGKLSVYDFIEKSDFETIKSATQELGTQQLKPLKDFFEDKFTYGQLKMAVAGLNR